MREALPHLPQDRLYHSSQAHRGTFGLPPPSFKVERGRGCELDETYFPEPFKGNHTKETFTIPPPDIAASRCTGVDCRVSRSAS